MNTNSFYWTYWTKQIYLGTRGLLENFSGGNENASVLNFCLTKVKSNRGITK